MSTATASLPAPDTLFIRELRHQTRVGFNFSEREATQAVGVGIDQQAPGFRPLAARCRAVLSSCAMFSSRSVRTRRIAAWMACLALLFGALSPVVARVMLAAQPGSTTWLEVCTSAGMKRVAIDVGTSTDGSLPDSAAIGTECPFCLLHAVAGLPGPIVAPALITPPARSLPPPVDGTWAQQPGPTWTLASPRAPPAHG
jgi:hypothetical protein